MKTITMAVLVGMLAMVAAVCVLDLAWTLAGMLCNDRDFGQAMLTLLLILVGGLMTFLSWEWLAERAKAKGGQS